MGSCFPRSKKENSVDDHKAVKEDVEKKVENELVVKNEKVEGKAKDDTQKCLPKTDVKMLKLMLSKLRKMMTLKRNLRMRMLKKTENDFFNQNTIKCILNTQDILNKHSQFLLSYV